MSYKLLISLPLSLSHSLPHSLFPTFKLCSFTLDNVEERNF